MRLAHKGLTLLTIIIAGLSFLLASSAAMAEWYPATGQGGP